MTFKPLHWNEPALFQENLLNLAYNIFKIQYFYEEAQLEKISNHIVEPKVKRHILQSYQDAADEAKTYLKAVQAFRLKKAKLPQEQEYFNFILEYFLVKENELSSFVINDEHFMKWMQERPDCNTLTMIH